MGQSTPIAKHLSIRGRVQGVGYRDSMRLEALHAGVTGWVRNRYDGSVEAWVEGPPDAVEAVLAWVHVGPPTAKVLHVDATVVEPGRFDGFERRPTA